MKHPTSLVPLILPKLSEQAAVQLLEILRTLMAIVEYHYDPQIQRWRQRQRRRDTQTSYPGQRLPEDELPF
ncbi:MAG: hypothetical protein K0B16_09180 [Burkholderiaceae bacterium]|nr:hypothetical protein [Burkholderiaceae bacterium]